MKNKKVIIGVAIGVVVAIIAAIAVAFVVVGNDDDDKSPKEKNKPEKNKVEVQEEQIESGPVVATYGDYELTAGEYNYFYMSLYNQVVNIANQYDQYYPGMGTQYFDVTVDPADQTCQEADHPDGVVTWADFFEYCAPERAFFVKHLYDEAMDNISAKGGFSISDEEKAEIEGKIDVTLEAYEEQAQEAEVSLDEYISSLTGEYVTAELYRKLLEMEYVAESYLSWYQDFAIDAVKDDELESYYIENKADIDVADIRVFGVSYASVSKDTAKSTAEDFVARLQNGSSFYDLAIEFAPESEKSAYEDDSATLMKYQTKKSLETIQAGLGEWVFDSSRVAGDAYIMDLPGNQAFFVIMVETPASKNMTPTSVGVRHILIEVKKTTADAEGSKVDLPRETIELNKQNSYAKAEEVVSLWQKNGGTEQAFIDLVSKYTNDPGSVKTGGLYEDINCETSFVPEFLEWSLEAHKSGDVDIIETTYGYHVMYYVGGDTTPKWESDVRAALGALAFEEYVTNLSEDIRGELERDEDAIAELREKAEEITNGYS